VRTYRYDTDNQHTQFLHHFDTAATQTIGTTQHLVAAGTTGTTTHIIIRYHPSGH
jgi:hypothetical protein